MAESSAYARRGFSGAALPTNLSSSITSSDTTISGASFATWTAADDNGPGAATITDGVNEECIEFTAVSGNQLTGVTRGVDGTTARAWQSGDRIEHGSRARDFDEANKIVNLWLGISGMASGDVFYWNGSAFVRLAKGTARQALIMNAGATAPSWGDSLASLGTTQGDTFYASAANTPARLAKGTALQVLRMNSGATAPEWGNLFTGCSAYSGATQAVNGPTTAAVLLGSEDFDTDGFHSTSSQTSRMTIPTGLGGRYRVTYSGTWVNTSNTAQVYFQLAKNGVLLSIGQHITRDEAIGNTFRQSCQGSAILDLVATDYIELHVTVAAASLVTLDGGAAQNVWVQIERIGV